MPASSLDILNDLIALARKAGADSADAIAVDSTDLSVSVRLGVLEHLERSEAMDVGLRVFVGQRQAIVSTTDRRFKSLSELAERGVAMARMAPEDPYCGIASSEDIGRTYPPLELADTTQFSPEELIVRATEAEEAARSVNGVTNSDGASAGWRQSLFSVAASNGFSASNTRTRYGLQASVLAGEGTGMQRDHESASRVFAADMPTPEWVGQRAGERAVKRVGARKMPTARIPVFFESRIAGSLVRSFLNAILGNAVARGTSFLKDKLGQKIFSDAISIVDDPHRVRGLRSKAFDVEGLLPQKRKLIDAGTLTTWLLDLRSARQLGMRSTGHASRPTGGTPSPSPTNVYLEPGGVSLAALMKDVAQGFYVIETMGMGVNGVTGDYSLAAAGFWIENGEISFPVNEMTIAGNLNDMFLNLRAADDLEFRYGIDAPTLRIDGMTVAGT